MTVSKPPVQMPDDLAFKSDKHGVLGVRDLSIQVTVYGVFDVIVTVFGMVDPGLLSIEYKDDSYLAYGKDWEIIKTDHAVTGNDFGTTTFSIVLLSGFAITAFINTFSAISENKPKPKYVHDDPTNMAVEYHVVQVYHKGGIDFAGELNLGIENQVDVLTVKFMNDTPVDPFKLKIDGSYVYKSIKNISVFPSMPPPMMMELKDIPETPVSTGIFGEVFKGWDSKWEHKIDGEGKTAFEVADEIGKITGFMHDLAILKEGNDKGIFHLKSLKPEAYATWATKWEEKHWQYGPCGQMFGEVEVRLWISAIEVKLKHKNMTITLKHPGNADLIELIVTIIQQHEAGMCNTELKQFCQNTHLLAKHLMKQFEPLEGNVVSYTLGKGTLFLVDGDGNEIEIGQAKEMTFSIPDGYEGAEVKYEATDVPAKGVQVIPDIDMDDPVLVSVVKRLFLGLSDAGFRVHYYTAKTTTSVYVKPDAGVLGSIRIGDHPGKKKYNYTYQIDLYAAGVKGKIYGPDSVQDMINSLKLDRKIEIAKTNKDEYETRVEAVLASNSVNPVGFWKNCLEYHGPIKNKNKVVI